MVANFGRFLLQDSEYDCPAGEEVDGLLDEADYCQLPQFGPSCRRRWVNLWQITFSCFYLLQQPRGEIQGGGCGPRCPGRSKTRHQDR